MGPQRPQVLYLKALEEFHREALAEGRAMHDASLQWHLDQAALSFRLDDELGTDGRFRQSDCVPEGAGPCQGRAKPGEANP